MYFNVALKNVKKSFRDYSVYFLTLALSVCIFYSFNSIESQKALNEVASADPLYMKSFMSLISIASVFVSIILGGLILYANNFLVKRRNKELGIYMTLGMSKIKILKILMIETIIVGVFSFISGLFLGIIASQGLSILISKIFDIKMSGYTFVISMKAMIKTIISFGIMFVLAIMLNSIIISKYKIIDLLTVGRKNEEVKFKNQFIYIVEFILSVISLGIAYNLILKNGLNGDNIILIKSIVLGVIGTVLFFFSLSGFILFIIKKNKKIYFKGLNIFTIKQINSKVNTNFISMSIICLMLFTTITTLSTGLSFKESLKAENEIFTPFDTSATLYSNKKNSINYIKEAFQYMKIKFDNDDKFVYYNEYKNGSNISDIIIPDDNNKYDDSNIVYVKTSDYNKIKELKKENAVNLKDNEILIVSNSPNMVPLINGYMKNNDTIIIQGKEFNIKNKEFLQESLKSDKSYIPFTVIANHEICDSMTVYSSNVDINFGGDSKREKENNFNNMIKLHNNSSGYDKIGYLFSTSKIATYDSSVGMTTKALFIAIYVGIVFLISSMAVLSLQQLSEASDSIERYVSLKKLGVNIKDINKTIFTQTLVYFSIPVILAIVHSVIGIKVASGFILNNNKPNVGGSYIVTAIIFITIYIIYFYVTYSGYKSIVKNKIV
ncbi:ABC transporter permease [Clostridium estertheticum]|uniref:FtsX-like permease family protein n=1 Tax=Clostridium estertheticum TaxID=238834 RepID=UPI001C0E7DD8|nr:ABC transporter permease [Clostridium estertheticum]MBU3216769.1 ABC transporter permease [Clostridium estertheticum]WAG54267.1 ABC transporter permease [Clostridium estertheticum]